MISNEFALLATKEPFERLQHREWEQQELLESLKQEINNLEPADTLLDPIDFHRRVVGALLIILGKGVYLTDCLGALYPSIICNFLLREVPEIGPLVGRLLRKIDGFTSSVAERNLITVRLLEYLISSFTHNIHSEFLRVSVHERKKFFKEIGYPINGCR